MDFASNLALGFSVALTPFNLFMAGCGVVMGILIGALPGAKGTTTSMVRVGYLAWAEASPGAARSNASEAAEANRSCWRRMPESLREQAVFAAMERRVHSRFGPL